MTASASATLHCKVAVVGAAHAGKTALVNALTRKSATNLRPNVQPVVSSAKVGDVQFYFVDAGGLPYSHKICRPQIEEANFVLLVFDAADRQSLTGLRKLISDLQIKDANCVVVATKNDLNTKIAGPSESEIAQFKQDHWKLFSTNQNQTQELSQYLVTSFKQRYSAFVDKLSN